MKRALIIGLALTGLVVGPAMAREEHGSNGGLAMGDHATTKLRTVKAEQGDVLSSKLIGLDVYDHKNESIGEIKDLVLKNGKTIEGVVISVGGFLGLGESYVLVAPSSIVINKKDGTMKAFVETDKDSLKNEPKFDYDSGKKS